MDIQISGLEKNFGKTQALKPLQIVMKQGEFTTLLGPSGCGKTTLLRMIADLKNQIKVKYILEIRACILLLKK